MVHAKVMVECNATLNNIPVIWWGSVEETGVTTDLPQGADKLDHIMLYRVYLDISGFELTMLVIIGTDCIGSCKSNYNLITNIKI